VKKNILIFKGMKRLFEVENEIRYLSALIPRKSRFGAGGDDYTIYYNHPLVRKTVKRVHDDMEGIIIGWFVDETTGANFSILFNNGQIDDYEERQFLPPPSAQSEEYIQLKEDDGSYRDFNTSDNLTPAINLEQSLFHLPDDDKIMGSDNRMLHKTKLKHIDKLISKGTAKSTQQYTEMAKPKEPVAQRSSARGLKPNCPDQLKQELNNKINEATEWNTELQDYITKYITILNNNLSKNPQELLDEDTIKYIRGEFNQSEKIEKIKESGQKLESECKKSLNDINAIIDTDLYNENFDDYVAQDIERSIKIYKKKKEEKLINEQVKDFINDCAIVNKDRDIFELLRPFDKNLSVEDQLKFYICYIQQFAIDMAHDKINAVTQVIIEIKKNVIDVIKQLQTHLPSDFPKITQKGENLENIIKKLFPKYNDNKNPDYYVTRMFLGNDREEYNISTSTGAETLEFIMVNFLEIYGYTIEGIFRRVSQDFEKSMTFDRLLQSNTYKKVPVKNQNILIVTDVYPTDPSKTQSFQLFLNEYINTRYKKIKCGHVKTIAHEYDSGTFNSWAFDFGDEDTGIKELDISSGRMEICELFEFGNPDDNKIKLGVSPVILHYKITKGKDKPQLEIIKFLDNSDIKGKFTNSILKEVKAKVETVKNSNEKIANALAKTLGDKAIRDAAQELNKVKAIKEYYKFGNNSLITFLSNDATSALAAAQTLPGGIFNSNRVVDELAEGSEFIAVRPGTSLFKRIQTVPELVERERSFLPSQQTQQGANGSPPRARGSPSKSQGTPDSRRKQPGNGALGGTPSRVRSRSKESEENDLRSPRRLFPVGSPRSQVSTQSQEFNPMNEFGKRSLQKKIHELEKEIKYLGKSNER